MNILYLCDEYPPGRHGGIGTAVQSQARELVVKGHKVIVAGCYDWGYGGENEFDDNGVKVFRFRRKLASSWFHKKDAKRVRAAYKLLNMLGLFHWDIDASMGKYRVFLESLIKEFNIQIVERPDFNEYVQYCIMPVNFPTLSVPVVVKVHGTISYIKKEAGMEPTEVVFRTEQQNINNNTALSSVSKYAADKTAQYFDYTNEIEVLYNGIAVPPFIPVVKATARAIFVGSLVEQKGVYQLMKAWNNVVAAMPEAELVLLGKGNVRKAKAYLSAQALDTVTFKGHVSKEDVQKEVSSATVAVFPSYAETFGLAAVEAMSFGTATIFTNRGAGAEMINNGIDGMIIDPDNVSGISETILLLFNDNVLRTSIEVKGRQRVQEEFEIGKIADKNIAFYEEVLARDK